MIQDKFVFSKHETFGKDERTSVKSYYHRSTGAPTLIEDVQRYVQFNNGAFHGRNVPDYWDRVKKGSLLPVTDYLRWDQNARWNGYHDFEAEYVGFTDRFYSEGPGPAIRGPKASSIHWDSTRVASFCFDHFDAGLTQRAAANLASQGFDGLTFLAEISKTVAMFKGVLRRWIKLAANGQFHKLWLEGRYGWRILVYDMQGINDLIENVHLKRDRYSRYAKDTYNFTEVEVIEDVTGWEQFTADLAISHTYSISKNGHVIADITPPDISFDPIKTSWELVTFSFVVDWVVQVGQWLDAMSFLAMSTDYKSSAGLQFTILSTHELEVKSWNVYDNVQWSGDVVSRGTNYLAGRARIPAPVSLNLQTTTKLDAFKVLDLVALFLEVIRR